LSDDDINNIPLEDMFDEDGEYRVCPSCELLRLAAAVGDARLRWHQFFLETKHREDKLVRENLATALHYLNTAIEHDDGRHRGGDCEPVISADSGVVQ
jgi:hypothetical protein